MITLARALDVVFTELGPLPRLPLERVGLSLALGRVLAADVSPERPVPHFARAAMDGFAVQAADLALARPDQPVLLLVSGTVLAGAPSLPVPRGQTVFVATGAALPPGADAVVPWEAVGASAARPEPGSRAAFRRPVAPGTNVAPPGEEIPLGAPALVAGVRMGPAALGLLAAMGQATVPVRRRPRVALLTTGDELVALGSPLPAGGAYESNTAWLRGACQEIGAHARVYPLVADRPSEIRGALERALASAPDLVLTTGGVSVGPADLLPAAWRALGAEELFWRVAMKPGKPVFAARLGRTGILSLSGSPMAGWTTFNLLVAPLLRQWLGVIHPFPAAQRGRLATPLDGRADLLRVIWSEIEEGTPPAVRPARRRAQGTWVQVARARGLLVQPVGEGPLPAGADVWVLRTDRAGEAGEADVPALLAAACQPGAGPAWASLPASPATPGRWFGGPAVAPPPVGQEGAAVEPGVVGVGGRSGQGKTTLLAGVIAALTAQGEAVATLKHHAHGVPLDAPGKDGRRHREAGARLTLVAGLGGALCSADTPPAWTAQQWVDLAKARAREAGCRWLFVEGFHALPLPRIEVLDTARDTAPLTSPEHGLFLVAASEPAQARVPAGVIVAQRDDIAAVLAEVRRQFAAGQPTAPAGAGCSPGL